MRRSKSKQRHDCVACTQGRCGDCIDMVRLAVGLDPRCPCTRKGHSNEPHGALDHVCDEICAIVNGPPGRPAWVCEECRAPWDPVTGRCSRCGNRTMVRA